MTKCQMYITIGIVLGVELSTAPYMLEIRNRGPIKLEYFF